MIIALLTDLHFGVRNGNLIMQEQMNKFINVTVIPELIKRKITNLIILGDFTDSRKSTNYKIIQDIKLNFFDKMKEANINIIMIGGNHDMFYRESNEVASFDVLFGHYDNVTTVTSPTEYNDLLLLPWINKENYDEVMDCIYKSKSRYCFGHFEFSGAKMYANSRAEQGMEIKPFSKFDIVFSGHYHHRSKYGNVQYIGAAGYYTWQDYNDFRGFTLFDTDTGKQMTIKNPYCCFHQITYNDKIIEGDDIPSVYYRNANLTELKDKYVDLVVNHKKDSVLYTDFLTQINESGYIDLRITDNTIFSIDCDDDVEIENKEVIQLVREYIKDNIDNDKEVTDLVNEIHNEVITI